MRTVCSLQHLITTHAVCMLAHSRPLVHVHREGGASKRRRSDLKSDLLDSTVVFLQESTGLCTDTFVPGRHNHQQACRHIEWLAARLRPSHRRILRCVTLRLWYSMFCRRFMSRAVRAYTVYELQQLRCSFRSHQHLLACVCVWGLCTLSLKLTLVSGCLCSAVPALSTEGGVRVELRVRGVASRVHHPSRPRNSVPPRFHPAKHYHFDRTLFYSFFWAYYKPLLCNRVQASSSVSTTSTENRHAIPLSWTLCHTPRSAGNALAGLMLSTRLISYLALQACIVAPLCMQCC